MPETFNKSRASFDKVLLVFYRNVCLQHLCWPFQSGKAVLTGNSEQDMVAMLMASPLFQQINDLQAMLDKDNPAAAAAASRVIGQLLAPSGDKHLKQNPP